MLADTIDDFLFTSSKSETPLNADERKRHEFIDCQVIELIRLEILPYASQLPREFMQRTIEILNRGSINTMDPHDVLGELTACLRSFLTALCLFSFPRFPYAASVKESRTSRVTPLTPHPLTTPRTGLYLLG